MTAIRVAVTNVAVLPGDSDCSRHGAVSIVPVVGNGGDAPSGWWVRASARGAGPSRGGEGFPGGTNRHAPGRTAR